MAIVTQLVTQSLARWSREQLMPTWTATPPRRLSCPDRQLRPGHHLRFDDPPETDLYWVPSRAYRRVVVLGAVYIRHDFRVAGHVSCAEAATLRPLMQTIGAHDDLSASAGGQRCLLSCMPAVVRPRCCTSCYAELTFRCQNIRPSFYHTRCAGLG
jgi:hypothetical protein